MKLHLLTALTVALVFSARAESTVTLTGVHNCCKSCEKGIAAAVAKVPGASVKADKTTVTITAANEADAKKATAALVADGYYGEGAEAPAVTDAKVKGGTVEGVHLCCAKCVTAFNKAATATAGVKSTDAVKGAKSVKIEGDFSTKEFAANLNKAGFSGTVK